MGASWEWKSFTHGGNSSSPSQFSDYGSGKTGHAPAWPGPAPSAGFQKGFARTYAVAIAGEGKSMFFNVSNNDFELKYILQGTDPNVASEIYVWPERYPGVADVVSSSSKGSVRVDYDGTGSQVLVYPGADAEEGAEVVVKISNKVKEPFVV